MLTNALMPIITLGQAGDAPLITIDRDNVQITQSCRVRIAQLPIIDADNNGVIHIKASDIAVEFTDDSPALHGANDDQTPDTFAGKGIVITGQNVTLAGGNAKVSGYKVGIHTIKSDGLTIHHCDVSNNFHQRLKSTPQAEDAGDWLWPHANDHNEWITNYGAGLCVEDCSNVTLHDIRARKTQNGIILDAVSDSKVYDCDCSFLSGWGLAMWRSNRNVISRNAFDFCVRGYSHGVYNRGQDSAGILMFEQCCDNVIAENSATHCGDGFFGFAGKQALGEVNPRGDGEWYKARGCNDNIFAGNDFSYASAHGLELTFSFRNRITHNHFVENAICGIWGGYSQQMFIDNNTFAGNGDMAYGLERGGVNIEHSVNNTVASNQFAKNACGVFLWWDADRGLLDRPWAKMNTGDCRDNRVLHNAFLDDVIGVQLQRAERTKLFANSFHGVGQEYVADEASQQTLIKNMAPDEGEAGPVVVEPLGEIRPVGVRSRLAGRSNIIMTEWGPWDHESPLLQFVRRSGGVDEYILRGVKEMPKVGDIQTEGAVFAEVNGNNIRIHPDEVETVLPYRLALNADGRTLQTEGVLASTIWAVHTFSSSVDPREDYETWRRDGLASAQTITLDALDLPFRSGGMSELHKLPAAMPRDHFGTTATTSLMFPPGRWRITTTSDDGIRVWMDEQLVIDDWTHHAPKKHTHDFEVGEGGRTIDFRVEHFELDGHAVLQLDIAPIP